MGRNKYPEETVAKILDAALELFCAQGYEGTSIQDIVDRLDGMTKGAVYHHFKSKEEIFNAAFDRAMTPIVEHRRSMLGVGNMTGAQKLKRLYAPEPERSGGGRIVVGESLAAAIVPSARAQGSNARSCTMFGADGGRGGARFG